MKTILIEGNRVIMDSVCVLMSTYNGEKFIEQQINSILDQKGVEVLLLIRDDSSKDNTVKIIRKLMDDNSNIRLIQGDNIGPAKSFLELIKNAPDSKFYALCDQDDFWINDKLLNAIKTIKKNTNNNAPILYHSNLTITDASLNPCRLTKKKRINNRYTCLVDNTVTGCTTVFNEPLKLLISKGIPETVTMHDVWLNMVASIFGKVILDDASYILYRQHGNNSIGMRQEINVTDEMKNKLKRLKRKDLQPRLVNAKSFLDIYGKMLNDRDYKKISKIINYKKSLICRIKLLLDFDIRSFSVLQDFRYRILILMGEI